MQGVCILACLLIAAFADATEYFKEEFTGIHYYNFKLLDLLLLALAGTPGLGAPWPRLWLFGSLTCSFPIRLDRWTVTVCLTLSWLVSVQLHLAVDWRLCNIMPVPGYELKWRLRRLKFGIDSISAYIGVAPVVVWDRVCLSVSVCPKKANANLKKGRVYCSDYR